MKKNIIFLPLIFINLLSCMSTSKKSNENEELKADDVSNVKEINEINETANIKSISLDKSVFKISHSINTSTSEYYPVITEDGSTLFFTGMDRSGFFDYKIDFTKTRNNGGEDLFISKKINGSWEDARDIKQLNTNAHESVTGVLSNGDMLITGNYPENMGPTNTSNGAATTDIFLAKKSNNFSLFHFDEPINSIFCESDAYMTDDMNTILFVSDRPGHIGEYHKKGWQWNESYWGNTDIYVSFKEGDSWTNPKNIGALINTKFTERTPWLSFDGLTLYLSSNGYNKNKKDLDIYFYKRKSISDWDNWEGPFEIKSLNSNGDDWGYKEDIDGNGYFARSSKLDYVPTKRGKDGTGFIFENNFRSGYIVLGQQSGSFKSDEQTDIYVANKNNSAIILPDILFDVNSYNLSKKFNNIGTQLLDFIKINNPKSILIKGYTDSDGDEQLNLDLSKNRADAISQLLKSNGVSIPIETTGYGKSNPVAPNNSKQNKSKNRRVEIFFAN